jgi:hypothetical protein
LLYAGVFSSASASLTCHRPSSTQINCELKRYNLLGFSQTLKVFDPYGAEVITHSGGRGGRTYQVMISTPYHPIPLMAQSTSNQQDNQNATNQINQFVTSGQSSLSVQQEARGNQFLFSLFALVTAGIGVFEGASPITTCTFYKQVMNKVAIARRGLRGNLNIEYPLSKIQRVEMQERKQRGGTVYRAVLVLETQERIPIHQEYTSEQKVRSVVYSINRFLESKI